ncbi:hypothetical protein KDN32_06420 [Nocardioides sp. J2M5]|uniref:hypothetical protein n=1 Tax=Nocardioides palaemonis TaxID=2829810 RepID=UPI001BAD43CE|nr:hypothetical protein [Nocardioides palaemonis]MBS2937370.1 hypothetical protein [Nocardioides palaemonis]
MRPTSTDDDRERRAARRAALRATHPDLGGDVDDFIAVMRTFERPKAAPTAAAPAGGAGAAARVSGPRPTITTTRRSRMARSARRSRRRFASLARRRLRGWPVRHYAHLIEETS